MDMATMLDELRSVVDDIVSSRYYWPDSRLLGYLSEGQDKFCEETGYFTDNTTHALTLEEGVYKYAIPDRVIQVLEIYDGRSRLGKMPSDDISSDGDLRRSGFEVVGMPTHWRTDRATGGIELSHTPTVIEDGVTLQLQVWRYSAQALDHMTDGAYDGAPEIPERFHRACIEWAAYKAFNHHDMEAQDPVKATDHLRSFQQYVTDGRAALARIQNHEVRVGTHAAYRT